MAYYASSSIVVFPSASATDAGKKLSESNIKNIVTRITSRNYKIGSSSFVISKSSSSITLSSGTANIQGYEVITTSNITIDYPENDGTYIIGLRVRFDAGTGNILGDVSGNNVGIDAGFFDYDTYKNDVNVLMLATGVLSNGVLTITDNPDVLCIIDDAIHARYADGVMSDGNVYYINQNLRTTDDPTFNSVTANEFYYKDNSGTHSVEDTINQIKEELKNAKGTVSWDTSASTTINSLDDSKLDKSEVVSTPTANKVLRLNASGVMPCNITGSASSAITSTASTYASYIGNASSHYSINQNLNKTNDVQFNSLYIGQGTLKNITYTNNKLSLATSTGGFGFSYNGADKVTISNTGNISATGTITGSRIYNAAYNDYAEWYERDTNEEIKAGDIIEINPDTGKCRLATLIASNMVIGVCSDSYGHILGGENLENMEDNLKKYIPVGLSGRVYVNVEDGVNIVPGQLIISSYNGKAMTKQNPSAGTVIGKAIGYTIKIDGVRKVLMQIMLR